MIGTESKSQLLQTLERAGRQREGRERERESKASSRKGGDEWTGQQGPRPHLQQCRKKRFVFPWRPQIRERAKQNKTHKFFVAHHNPKPQFLF